MGNKGKMSEGKVQTNEGKLLRLANPPSCLQLDDLKKKSFTTTLLSVKRELETITNGISVRILFKYVVTSDVSCRYAKLTLYFEDGRVHFGR